MPLATVFSRANVGVDSPLVRVETHLSGGLPAFHVVGLPEATVKEARDRVRSALLNTGHDFPAGRITVNLAPADLPKEGGRFDLPIALGILAAAGIIPVTALDSHEFLGELGLGGEIRPVSAILPAALRAADSGRALILPRDNATTASLCASGTALPANDLQQVVAHLCDIERLSAADPPPLCTDRKAPDMADVCGQQQAKRGLAIAAAGGHHVLLSGPPGTGKTLLASRLPGILPALTETEMLECMAVHSVAGQDIDTAAIWQRPFRQPHHSATAAALVGGGSHLPKPGEISLAHRGVLFLDELPEFSRKVLDSLRQPLESGTVVIARARATVTFPAAFQLIAAMNPCPCGYHGDPFHACACSPDQIRRYQARISGPLLDRIDLRIAVPRLPPEQLHTPEHAEDSVTLRGHIEACRQRQLDRQGCTNQALDLAGTRRYCVLESGARQLHEQAAGRLGLSARAQHRQLRLARTIADMDSSEAIGEAHLLQALNFRGEMLH